MNFVDPNLVPLIAGGSAGGIAALAVIAVVAVVVMRRKGIRYRYILGKIANATPNVLEYALLWSHLSNNQTIDNIWRSHRRSLSNTEM